MIPGLCINKSKHSSISNTSLPYIKQTSIIDDILEDSIIGKFYGRIFHYNGRRGKKKKMKQTRKIKKGMKKKTKKKSSYSSLF